jgi:hypothetical protein
MFMKFHNSFMEVLGPIYLTRHSDLVNYILLYSNMGMGQNPIPLVNIKIAGKWMFIPLKMYL